MDSYITWVKGLAERVKEAERMERLDNMDIRPLLGIGSKKNTVYHCQFCDALTNGLTSYKGYICCPECKDKEIDE